MPQRRKSKKKTKTRVTDVADSKKKKPTAKPSRAKPKRVSLEDLKRKSQEEIQAKLADPGKVVCLGWCNKEFNSPNKKKVRFCSACRLKKDGVSRTHNWRAFGIVF